MLGLLSCFYCNVAEYAKSPVVEFSACGWEIPAQICKIQRPTCSFKKFVSHWPLPSNACFDVRKELPLLIFWQMFLKLRCLQRSSSVSALAQQISSARCDVFSLAG